MTMEKQLPNEKALPLELLAFFREANVVNKQTTFRASMPYRIGATITRAVNGLPVALRALHYYDGLILKSENINPVSKPKVRKISPWNILTLKFSP